MSYIKYFVMDVDGTLTDGKIYMSNEGEIFKAFDIKDGYGIHEILPRFSIIPIIITGRYSKIVENRCYELDIEEIYQGIKDKYTCLDDILKRKGDVFSSVAYMGDDIADYECMKIIRDAGGLTGCPSDAVTEIKKVSNYISDKSGGNGAARDFIEWIINKAF